MKIIHYITICCLLAIVGCKEEGRLDHIDSTTPAPSQVSNVKVESIAGGAILTYDIPKDDRLSYVLAVYDIQPGVTREAKSSIYTDTLKLDGFGDTELHTVKLYSVGKNEKRSEPLEVNFQPLIPPVQSVFKSMTLDEAFGGVSLRFQNETSANLVVYVMIDTTGQDDWSIANTFFTAAKDGKFSIRGLDPEEKKFAVYIQDRWSNKSDTLLETLTPLFEEEISKDNWKNMKLPGDQWEDAGNGGYALEKLWNKNLGFDGFAASNTSILPHHFTIDLGGPVTLSRFKAHHFGGEHGYNSSALKKFEMYGSNSPDPDGGWDNWELLGTFESYKPSGLPRGQTTAEDRQYADVDGEDFEFETMTPSFRYLRLRSLESYSSTGQITIAELTLFGRMDY